MSAPADGEGGKGLGERVQRAFEAVRQGDLGPVSALQQEGPAAVPFLSAYVQDASEAVRREAVSLLSFGGVPALPLLAPALADPSADIRERAAQAMYRRYDPPQVAAHAPAGPALRACAASGDPAAAALLLLAYFPGPETERVLRAEVDRAPPLSTKLYQWSAPVPTALPARVALSRLGDNEARSALWQQAAAETGLAPLVFLLAALREVDEPKILHALKRALDDERETGSGAPVGVEPARRLCDDAVNAFVRRLGLPVSFPLSDARRYSPAEIAEVRRRIDEAIPQ
jgi:hypothetical protein